MRLDVNGRSIANASADDIGRAIKARRGEAEWSICLAAGDSESIEANWTAGDNFRIAYVSGTTIRDGNRQVGAEELRELLTAYLSGDQAWRERISWSPGNGWSVGASAGSGRYDGFLAYWPVAAIAVAALAAWFLAPAILQFVSQGITDLRLPAAIESIQARVILGLFAVCVLLFLVAALVKGVEVRGARHWRRTKGRITSSREGFVVEQPFREEMPRNRRVAEIEYTFDVAGKTYNERRISFAEKIPEEEVPALVAKYRRGAVVDVFYNPKKPGEAVLEKDFAGELMSGCLLMFGAGIVATVIAMWAATHAPALIRMQFPHAIVPLVVFFAVGGTFVSLAAIAALKSGFAAKSWPRTPGRIVLSSTMSYSSDENRQMHMPVVEYTYAVAGKPYSSRSIQLDSESAGSEAYATKTAARYPKGMAVTVFYDPANPSRAALDIKSMMGWWLLVLAGVLFMIAMWAAGAFSDGPVLTQSR